ncbi:flagellin N-terminal helical domain-containing protein [Clostridium sulfidigenes]|uniref:flagellin N-terminal helical domain-containing protein n=1 Tax=Clostridium sulfidigenes TaxID=318464 RepID=UPI003F8BCE8A
MRLSRNMSAMRIFNSYTKNLVAQSKAYGSISSGNKIQTYRDDPNAKAKSDKLKLEIRGLQMATRNIQDSVSLMQTMDGGMQSISESLQRARELMVQAGGATTPEDRAVIQKEIDQNLEHITYTANNTEMNGVKLLADKNNPGDTVDLLIGATSDYVTKLPTYNLTSTGLGLVNADGSNKISVENMNDGLKRLDDAIDKLSSGRGKYGALSNRMESTADYTSEIAGKVEGAEGEITGTDIALEMVEYAKNSILVESGMAMMAQSNEFPQDILQILSNVYPNR